jgi:RHS repeat-associated protein
MALYNVDVTNSMATNEILQETHYYPFGLSYEGPWLMNDAARDDAYKYNGKEWDETMGLYDYGARWYDPVLGRWGQVDPLAAKYVTWSPYNYVLGNPMRLVDPDGRSVEATYKVDREGVITKVDDKQHYDDQGNEVDLLVAGDQVDYDKNGEVKQPHVEVQKGALRGVKNITASASDGSGQTSGTLIGFGPNEESAREVFEFLANNTDVEWAIFKDEPRPGAERTQLTTSHEQAEESLGASLATDTRLKLFYHDHSHPTRGIMNDDSRLFPSDADKAFASSIRADNPKVSFRIYFSGAYRNC